MQQVDVSTRNVRGVPSREPAKWRRIAPWLSYWVVMAVSFALTRWLSGEGHVTATAAYVMAVGNMIIVIACEALIPRRPQDQLFHDRQSWNDVAHLLLFKFGIRPVAWVATIALVGVVNTHLQRVSGFWPSHWPFLAQFVVLLLAFDLIGYVYHRTLHSADWLFAFHALHHDTRRVHMLKAVRVHFGEEFVNFLLVVPLCIVAGCPTPLLTWLGMWNVFESNLAHSNVDQRFPNWVHYVVRTSGVHYIHHSEHFALQNSNFGGLPIWDIIFGTYRHPSATPVTSTGLHGNPVPRNFIRQLWFPFVALLRPAAGRERMAADAGAVVGTSYAQPSYGTSSVSAGGTRDSV
jgi:sterol desaturase/sphingolipid hydroxylase (fatty acid hydroxylase superfamily)